MKSGCKAPLLQFLSEQNEWMPPKIAEYDYAVRVKDDINARQSDQFLYIFQTEPYIDSIYIEYDYQRNPKRIRRFAFHEGYCWDREDEKFYSEHCVKEERCASNGGAINQIYEKCSTEHPEWHLQRYYTKSLRMLDHIYHCLRRNTAQEMLYKAGLDELAAHIDEIDELNMLATKPSELYDDIPIKVLRSLNCVYGSILLKEHASRIFVRDLNYKFPELFGRKLNDAQCRYISTLIKGDLTVGETGRLFEARRKDLAGIWTMSLFDIFMIREKHEAEIRKLCEIYGTMDTIYDSYIKSLSAPEDDFNLKQLELFLLINREDYDKAIRRSNRKRDYDWQERGKKYYVRYPQTINDFCREALYMHNCLLTYVEAYIDNDTTILFMRKSDDANKPFITMEIFEGELMQAYHRFNEDCTPEEAEWITDYCIRHGIKTGKFKFDAAQDELF